MNFYRQGDTQGKAHTNNFGKYKLKWHFVSDDIISYLFL